MQPLHSTIMFKISTISKVLLVFSALALFGLLKLPIWKIFLTAPQYPEGLEMKIWHHTLTGDVKIISALNHYIGMRAISEEMFPEFQFLGTVIMIVGGACLLLALIGRWWSALCFYLILAIADSLALYDFWRWGYDYGHNLNPNAPIVIPGMVYQPPVIGYKKLLNFEAWSLPDAGGWIIIAATTISLFILAYEWWRHRKIKKGLPGPSGTVAGVVLFLSFPVLFGQCSAGPRPINYGTDACAFCKMMLMDQHFGAEVLTKKGKIYVLDDINCLVSFQKKGGLAPEEIAGVFVIDYAHPNTLLEADRAFYIQSEQLKSPMASGVAAFASQSGIERARSQIGGEMLDWETVQDLF
ncbi:MAG: nitrous oxide reductase accessory protein NosL [Saprospiraceae bacterium]